MTDSPNLQHNQGFMELLQGAQSVVAEIHSNATRSKQSLYQLLERTYQIAKQAEKAPDDFMKFTQTTYDANGWGKVGAKPLSKVYAIILKMAFGKDADKTAISRYSTALKRLEIQNTSITTDQDSVSTAIEESGGVESLIAAARDAKKVSTGKPKRTMEDDEKAVLRNQPTHTFEFSGQSGFKLALIHVDDKGVAKILSERPDKDVKAAILAASKERYPRLSPTPYVGGKYSQLRLLDQWFPDEISEYREPFIGGGATFLFIKNSRPGQNIKYWINDKAGDVFRFWSQIQSDPVALVKAIQSHIDKADGDANVAKQIMNRISPDRVGDDQLLAATAFLLSKLWSFRNMDNGGVSPLMVKKDPSALFNKILNVVHPLLKGVKITNKDVLDLLKDSPKKAGVFIFLDPPYDDQESLYQTFLGNRTAGASAELRKQELVRSHWEYSMAVAKCPHRWLMTHSDTELFKTRSVFTALSQRDEFQFQFHKHKIMSGITNKVQTEVLTSNYKPGEPDTRLDTIRKLDQFLAEQGEIGAPIDWADINQQLGVTQAQVDAAGSNIFGV
ncbi:putative cytosine specific DNA methyltransferase [Magnetospirillum gryphiswaldense MSR-1 v2]|uniref:site-specific DNA-methyltransferase (adenine-specific) n=1 Tax=Magnetospirillum gryphiswaldense (strain DSM 6361 / JCM 21280 / NBRC 15271 / MSR-1) TaxID=431944 RepID=V6F5A5_MAGGM|nr:DNA adenine methylase [Magnetospirillum gryphiswaldense]CDL00557.1 putative cytosine specific DNA methyltransferase [Magnetospirillum gryphiswaldense MSR-1 v2]